jgi:dihydrodipicolinate synthase/N-acetylneuraminate lyase
MVSNVPSKFNLYRCTKAGILAHFGAVLDYGPTIVYNVPARTSQDIPPEIMFQLAEHENFAGKALFILPNVFAKYLLAVVC